MPPAAPGNPVGANMENVKLKRFLALAAIITLINGVSYTLVPGALLPNYGLQVTSAAELGFRLFGRALFRDYPFEEAYFLPMARRFRAALSLPLILLGGINTVATIRQAMGVRTVFNILGPLTNPAAPRYQLTGAFNLPTAQLMADALAGLPIERAFVRRQTHADLLKMASLDVAPSPGHP